MYKFLQMLFPVSRDMASRCIIKEMMTNMCVKMHLLSPKEEKNWVAKNVVIAHLKMLNVINAE